MLEELPFGAASKSYIYLEQNVISESDDLLITFQTKNMPRDWVGSDLFEVSSVPYNVVKSDSYGVLEHIGEWMRFTPNKEVDFTIYAVTTDAIAAAAALTIEYNNIRLWIDKL
jgi:hypothetical protein